jgi:hypothetical protein
MTTNEKIKNELFETKEDYLAFRKAWADYINSGKHRPTYEETEIRTWCPIDKAMRPQKHTAKTCHLDASQQLLFCLLAGKDLSVTFKPSPTNRKDGFTSAKEKLYLRINEAKFLVDHDTSNKQVNEHQLWFINRDRMKLSKFIEPFGITIETLASLHLYASRMLLLTNEEVTKEAA